MRSFLFALFFLARSCYSFSWAVCLTGEARSVANLHLVTNVRSRLLASLPEATSVDTYAVLSKEDEVHHLVLHAVWPELTGRVLFYKTPPFTGTSLHEHGHRFYLQWAKIEACLRMVEQNEETQGKRYDFFLRARSDLYYFVPVNTWLSASFSTVQVGAGLGCTPSDHFGAMPRHLAALYASAGEISFDKAATTHAISEAASGSLCHCPGETATLWPECLIAAWLRLHHVPFYIACNTQFGLWRHTSVSPNGELVSFGQVVFTNATSGLVEPNAACTASPAPL